MLYDAHTVAKRVCRQFVGYDENIVPRWCGRPAEYYVDTPQGKLYYCSDHAPDVATPVTYLDYLLHIS